MRQRMIVVCSAFAFTAACAGHGVPATADDGAGAVQSARTRDRSLITRDELSENPTMNAQSVLDAIRSLRPQFLTQRGKNSHSDDDAGKTHASIDGGRIVPLEELGNMHVASVLDIRFLDAAAAMQRFGGAAREGPVILVRTIGK
ncbi:MAG TPA: hypothetical protein VNS10_06555 [Gemmatimonadaceae bacterium]|jgi:hypothetical protein|nr:hypothetical protein [Gemmatimonadaceae bacterium]